MAPVPPPAPARASPLARDCRPPQYAGLRARRVRPPMGRIRAAPVHSPPRQSAPATAMQRRVCVDRKSVVEGKSVSVRVDLGGRRIIKKKKTQKKHHMVTI